jgi:hypothetical protein
VFIFQESFYMWNNWNVNQSAGQGGWDQQSYYGGLNNHQQAHLLQLAAQLQAAGHNILDPNVRSHIAAQAGVTLQQAHTFLNAQNSFSRNWGTEYAVPPEPLQNIVQNSGRDYLYRGDSRPPETILRSTEEGGGFQPRGTNTDLDHYVRYQTDSGFVSTSRGYDSAAESAFGDDSFQEPQRGYVYTINNTVPNQRDVNAEMGMSSHLPGEEEIAIQGRISPSDIRYATELDNDNDAAQLGTYHNPLWRDR